ncbi:MAG: hypothetical protein JWN78_1296 [Bacteroidota bacterium]|nr:hypothetical protein [Bacteroidota bacterium]
MKEVNTDIYFSELIFYIHANPQLHRLTSDFKKWKYSSYHKMMIDKDDFLKKNEVLDWFGGIQQYWEFHEGLMHLRYEDKFFKLEG